MHCLQEGVDATSPLTPDFARSGGAVAFYEVRAWIGRKRKTRIVLILAGNLVFDGTLSNTERARRVVNRFDKP